MPDHITIEVYTLAGFTGSMLWSVPALLLLKLFLRSVSYVLR